MTTRLRATAAAAVAGGLLLSVSGAQAATPVMDGKKVKVLTKTFDTGIALDLPGYASYETETCENPKQCPTLPFIYAPAKGTKGGLMFTVTWGNQASDMDLDVVQYDSRGNRTVVAKCYGSALTTEKAYLPPSALKKGAKYAVVVYVFRSVADKLTSRVEIGVPSAVSTTLPPETDQLGLNCTL